MNRKKELLLSIARRFGSTTKQVRAGTFVLGLAMALGVSADLSTLGVADVQTTITDGVAGALSFAITRGADSSYDAYVSYATQDGSAVAGTDYSAVSGVQMLPAGVASPSVSVPIAGEPAQPDKTLQLRQIGATGVGPAPSFAAVQSFAFNGVATESSSTSADLNGDGKPDLIILTNGITVRVNTTAPGAATATFGATQNFPIPGGNAVAIVTADLNGDGKPDLIAGDRSGGGSVSVFINTTPTGSSTLSFSPRQTFASQPVSIAVADINGDGKPDVIALRLAGGVGGQNEVDVLLNTTTAGSSTASFAAPLVITGFDSGGSASGSIGAGDLNGDGQPDLFFTTACDGNCGNDGIGALYLLRDTTTPGATAASFAALQKFQSGGTQPFELRSVDVNQDGKPDLVTINRVERTVAILINTTAPGATTQSFGTTQNFNIASSVNDPRDFLFADVNGDGKPDLIVGDANPAVFINTTIPGATLATFETPRSFASVADDTHALNVADYNGDGKPDIVTIGRNSGNVGVLLNTTVLPGSVVAAFSQQPIALTGFTNNNPQGAAVGDVNGDGKPDVAVTVNNTAAIILNTSVPGTGITSFGAAQLATVGGSPAGIAFADFNGDGKADLVVGNGFDNNVSVLRNDTAPGAAVAAYAAQQTFAIPNGFIDPVATPDIDGDGRPDIVVFNSNGVQVLLNTTTPGASTFTFTAAQSFDGGASFISMVASDLNGDGRPDVVTANQDAGISALFDTTTPGAASASFSARQAFGGTNARYLTIADINKDGLPDIVSANERDGTIAVWLNTGLPGAITPSFSAPQLFSTGPNFQGVSIVSLDLDGDGRPDIVASESDRNGNGGSANVILLNTTTPGSATASFASPSVQPFRANGGLITGDFNIDGKPDVAVFRPDGGSGLAGVTMLLDSQYLVVPQATPATGTIHYTGSSTPNATLSTGALDYGNQIVGTTSAEQLVTVTNNGTAPLNISSIATVGDFAYTSDCPISGNTLAVGASCTIHVTFTPTDVGPLSGTLTVNSNDSTSFNVVSLDGSGIAATYSIDASPSPLDFGLQPVGTSGNSQDLTVTNNGNSPITVTGLSASGDSPTDFSIVSNGCAAALAAGDSCTISLRFTPGAEGARSAIETINTDRSICIDNGCDTRQPINAVVSVSGTGTQPGVSLSPAADFGSVVVGSSSASQAITLSNTGNSALTISLISSTGDYSQSNNCPASLAAGGSCMISVIFAPTATGTRTGTITVTSNAASSPDAAGLTGVGTAPGISINPASLDFGNQTLSTSSTAQSFIVHNTGSASLTVGTPLLVGNNPDDFAVTSNACTAPVAPAGQCTISLRFTPSTAGSRSAILALPSNASVDGSTVSLSGTGVTPPPPQLPALQLSPTSLQFGSQLAGSTSSSQTVTLSNSGNAPLAIGSIIPVGDFAQTNTCPVGSESTLQAGASCTITVSFTPTAVGARSGSIAISSNAASTPDRISLTGSGTAPGLSLSPSHVDYPDQAIGTTGPAQTVTLTNSGSAALLISAIAASGDYTQTNTCGSSLNAGASCTITISFTPGNAGLRTGAVTISSNAPGNAMQITLSGTGLGDQITVKVKAGGGASGWPLLLGFAGLLALRSRRHIRRHVRAALALLAGTLVVLPAQALKLDEVLNASYIGVRAGYATTTQDSARLTRELHARGYDVQGQVSADHFSGTVFAGYRVDDYFAIELAYTHLPELTASVSGTRPPDLNALLHDTAHLVRGYGDSYSLGLRYFVPLGHGFEFQPRAGISLWQTHTRIKAPGASLTRDDIGPGGTVGGGLHYAISPHLGIGVGYDFYLSTRPNQFGQIAGSIDWRFGSGW